MLKAEMKKDGHVEIEVTGNVLELIIECHAACVAVAELFPTEEGTELFLNDLPKSTKNYRQSIENRIKVDNDAIRKVKED